MCVIAGLTPAIFVKIKEMAGRARHDERVETLEMPYYQNNR